MNRLGSAMWGSLALIAWTHAGYPAAAAAARVAQPLPPAHATTPICRPSRS